MKRLLLAMLVLPLLALAAHAATLQETLALAKPGDTVTVPPGKYDGAISLKDGVVLISEGGPEQTIIDAQGAPYAVTFGKESAIIGFTIQNANQGVYNIGNFIGVFECIVTNFAGVGINIEKGSAAIMNNQISGGKGTTGINCTESNPYVGYNLIENNQVGFNVSRWLIPTLDHNIFRNNEIAIQSVDGTEVITTGNIFEGNGKDAVGLTLGTNNQFRAATAEELALRRGTTADAYRTLMKQIYQQAAALQPRIIYDLTDTPGKFNLIVTYPYATFSVSASARDTVIKNYDAYDRDTDASLNAQYCVVAGGYPTVAVINPQITDKAFDRYVLEKTFEHPASYSVTPDGKRIFDRLTNLPRVEILLPAGWAMESANPGATVEQRGPRQVVKLFSMGMTQLHLVIAPQAAPAP